MKRIAGILIVSFGSALLAGAGAGTTASDTNQRPGAPAAVYTRFSGTTKVNATSLRVEITEWQLVAAEQGVRLPVTGFHLAQLTSGRVDTEINGRMEHRKAGDYWTVQPGETMTIHFPPHSESAKIQTVAIK